MQSSSYLPGLGHRWVQRATVAAALIIGAYLIFEFGRIQAKFNIVDAVSEQQALENEVKGLENQITALKQEIALLKTHRDIDHEAYQVVEKNLGELQKKIQEQRDAIAFYRGIVSPADGGRGLRVQDLKLTKGKDERQYHVRLVLVQVMHHDRKVRGEVGFSTDGAQNGVSVPYAPGQLFPVEAVRKWPGYLVYCIALLLRVVGPAGFTPERVNIEVISRTKSIASVKQSFLWGAGQS